MKTKKILLIALIAVLTLFAAVGCSEDLFLNQILRVTSNVKDTSVEYTQNTLTDEDGSLETLSFVNEDIQIITLSDSTNDFITFNQLRLELIGLHEELVNERELLRASFEEIKNNVTTLRDMNFIILDDDKEIIKGDLESLRSIKAGIIETRGQAYQRIYDLRGTYTRDNLAEIIIVYQEVIEVLNTRLEFIRDASLNLENINSILLNYLEE